jgi:hypothetical protein
MTKFQITSAKIGATLTFGFNSNGALCAFEITDAELTVDETMKVFGGVFFVQTEFLEYCKRHKVDVVEILPDISFDAFWKKYDYKQGKVKAAQEWQRLSQANQTAAMAGIAKYKRNIPTGIAPVYAERYLKYKRWEDN